MLSLPDFVVYLCCLLQTFPYRVIEESGLIDYDQLEANAALYRPKLLIAGASAYTRHYDYPRMRQIADKHNAWLMSDMAHISGLVAAGTSAFCCFCIITLQTAGPKPWLSPCVSGPVAVHAIASAECKVAVVLATSEPCSDTNSQCVRHIASFGRACRCFPRIYSSCFGSVRSHELQ